MPELEAGEYHAKAGLTFRRMPDGSVRVRIYRAARGPTVMEAEFDLQLEPSVWCSVVAAVSPRGDTIDAHEDAKKYHGVL